MSILPSKSLPKPNSISPRAAKGFRNRKEERDYYKRIRLNNKNKKKGVGGL